MKTIRLQSPQYILLEKSFENWLRTLNYAESTVYNSPSYVKAFFSYLEQNKINSLNKVNRSHVESYYDYLCKRKHKRREGGLSTNYLLNNINALKRFGRYLQQTRKQSLEVNLEVPKDQFTSKVILSKEEVQQLYNACDDTLLGVRDRAMLSIYYGCGLRKSEGMGLNTDDIQLDKKLVYVRQGKNNKERLVPMSTEVQKDIEHWLSLRYQYLKNPSEQALFVSRQANRICGNAVINRVKILSKRAELQKEIGIHSLRHSIATHLLQSGMTLENISRFLGHSSLESTQIYTHIMNESF